MRAILLSIVFCIFCIVSVASAQPMSKSNYYSVTNVIVTQDTKQCLVVLKGQNYQPLLESNVDLDESLLEDGGLFYWKGSLFFCGGPLTTFPSYGKYKMFLHFVRKNKPSWAVMAGRGNLIQSDRTLYPQE